VSPLKLVISTPIQPIPRGFGFFQTEEQSLYVQLGGLFDSRRFYSFIDSPISRFDIDRCGHLLFFEVKAPRNHWRVTNNLTLPESIEPADIRWLGFRLSAESPKLQTNEEYSVLKLQLSDATPKFNYYLADSVIIQVDQSDNAVAIMITEIAEDSAGRKIAEFRRDLRGKTAGISSSSQSYTITFTVS